MIYLIFFFKDLTDATDFYNKLPHTNKLLGRADTIDYGLCYFVSVGYPENMLAVQGENFGLEEWKLATKYYSYLGHESALSPTDVDGFIGIISQTPPPIEG